MAELNCPAEKPDSGRRPWAAGAVILLLVISHFLILAIHVAPALSTPDANAYFVSGKLIAETGRPERITASPLQFVDDHWVRTADRTYSIQYPPGLPVLIAAVVRTFGVAGAFWLMPAMASLSLLGIGVMVWNWVGRWWAVLGVLVLALNPFFNKHSLFQDAHVAVTCFLVWGVALMDVGLRRRSMVAALAGGFLIGVIPSIRYPEAIFIPVLVIFAMWELSQRRRSLMHLMPFLFGMAAPVVALAAYNQFTFGAWWRTGYLHSGDQTGFGLNHLANHAWPYVLTLATAGVGPMFFLGITGLVLLIRAGSTRSRGVLLLGLIVPLTLLYMAYYWDLRNLWMRFLVPTVPFYIIASVWGLKLFYQGVSKARPWVGHSTIVVFVLLTMSWGGPASLAWVRQLHDDNMQIAQVADFVRSHVEPGSVVIAEYGVCQDLDFVADYALLDASARLDPGVASMAGVPRRSSPSRQQEIYSSLAGLSSGEVIERYFREADRLVRDRRGPVYWLAAEKDVAGLMHDVRGGSFEVVATLTLLDRPAPVGVSASFADEMPRNLVLLRCRVRD